MTSETRSAERNDLDSMTREFLAKGGKIMQCPPGASENVVYKRTAFRRRNAPEAKPDTPAAAGAAIDGADGSGTAASKDQVSLKDQVAVEDPAA